LLGRYSRQVRRRCASVNVVYWRAGHECILEHYFALEPFAAVLEAFRSAYSDMEVVPSKTTIHLLVTTFRNTVFVSSDHQGLITSVPISNSA
jgi:hypothetical protein